MNYYLALAFLLALPVAAQAPKQQVAPTATPNFCDATYSADVETADNDDVSSSAITIRANPYQDIADDHKRQVQIVDMLSKAQNKGGPYTITVTETNTCDGGPTVRVPTGSIFVEGVTLKDQVQIVDKMLQLGKEINDRYRGRADKGATTAWNHKNSKKVQRDEFGRRIKTDVIQKSN